MAKKTLDTSTSQPKPMSAPMGRGPIQGSFEKPKNFKATMKKLIGYLKPHWISMIVVLIFTIASTAFAIASPKILGNATNEIVNDYINITAYDAVMKNIPAGVKIPAGTTAEVFINKIPEPMRSKIPADKLDQIKNLDLSVKPTYHFEDVAVIMGWLIVLYLASALFSYIEGWIMASVSQKITYRMRRELSQKINRLPLSYFDKNTYGEVLSKITNDVDTISSTLNQSLSQMLTSVIMLIGILGMMLSISWILTIVAIVILPISFGLIMFITKRSQKEFVRQQKELGELNGHIEEMYSGHIVMKAFNGESSSLKKFNTINERLESSAWKSQFYSGLIFPIMNFIGNLGYVGVSIVGGWLAINGRLQIGDIQAFIQYVQQFNQPIAQTANIANVLQSTAAAAERVFEFLGETEETKDTGEIAMPADIKGEVEFHNVVFGYDKEKPVIKNLNLKIEPGHRVAIVGPTGAGKTTMVNLLMRFYEVDGGSITIDGIDIRNLPRPAVRRLFGMVLQDTWLFNGTIKQNIKYGNSRASDSDLQLAAENAHVDHFVKALPHGYDMEINEEASNISQGEKQLLTIARAMLSHTPMLILDEATSSVDTRTEVLIQKAMDNLMKNKTSFVIAHRLSTIRDADLIIVMNDGHVVENGNHKQLLAQKGFYSDLYNSQFASAES
jgi:ATP-binding cassette subfamily B protein